MAESFVVFLLVKKPISCVWVSLSCCLQISPLQSKRRERSTELDDL